MVKKCLKWGVSKMTPSPSPLDIVPVVGIRVKVLKKFQFKSTSESDLEHIEPIPIILRLACKKLYLSLLNDTVLFYEPNDIKIYMCLFGPKGQKDLQNV